MNQLEQAAREAIEVLRKCKTCSLDTNVRELLKKQVIELEAALAQQEETVPLSEYKELQKLVTSQGVRLMEYESQQEKPEPVALPPYLLNGTRFKVSSDGGNGALIFGVPYELVGAWVAFVAADNNCHLQPPRREWVGLTEEQILECIKKVGIEGYDERVKFAHLIQEKLKELNT